MTVRAMALLVLVALGTFACGCGVSLNGAAAGGARGATPTPDAVAAIHLPPRPQGEVDVEGSTPGSLSTAVVDAYQGSGARIVLVNTGEAQGFAELCRGETDVVDSTAPITPAELSVCQADGVQPVQLKVAADAAVLATGGEVDVGADCLTLAQVKQIFQAGSEVTNWSQLGYYDIPLRVAGPGEGKSTFALLGEDALGASAPTLANLRGDYQALSSEAAVRNAVSESGGGASSAQLHSGALASLNALRRAIGEAHGFVHEAELQVSKGVHDRRSAAAQARDRANLARAQANLATLLGDLPPAERYVGQTALAVARFQSGLGTVGYFSFNYYQAHEEELRPLEIDSGTHRPLLNCIFPSAQTVADGAYPLSRPLLLTVSLQDMKRPEVEDFLRFYLAQASGLAETAGLVALPPSMLSMETAWLDGQRQPQIVSAPGPGATVPGEPRSASTTRQELLVPAGGAGDQVSSADVPTGAAASSGSSSEAGSGEHAPGETPQSGGSSQSSQPLIAGQ